MEGRVTEPPSGAEATHPRIAVLDVLRAIACLWVVLTHAQWPASTPSLLRGFARTGRVGVDIFFVLSGFLVSSLLFREHQSRGSVSTGRFLARRGFKIYPAFYVFLVIGAVAIHVFATNPEFASLPRIFAEAIFFQNYFEGVWGHTWSLAVEEHFYVLVALAIWFASQRGARNPFRLWPRAVVLVSVACLALRFLAASQPFDVYTHVYPTHLRLDALAFGSLLSYLWVFEGDRWIAHFRRWRVPLLVVGSALICWPMPFPDTTNTVRWAIMLTTNYLGAGAVLAAALTLTRPLPKFVDGVAAVGRQSYSIYLWHGLVVWYIVPRITTQLISINPYAPVLVAVAMSIGIGWGMAILVERPFLALRERVVPPRARAAAT